MAFEAIPTLAGQAAIAAAVDPDNPVPLVMSEMVVGDGNGNPITPIETMTGLVNQRAVVPLAATERDGNKLTIDAILDDVTGGFTIREAGILDEDGVLLFVASIPATDKRTLLDSVVDILTLGLIVIVSDTATINLISAGTTYATHDYVNSAVANRRSTIATPLQVPHVAVVSMAQASPPSAPTPGNTWLVPADATGGFAGQTGKLAQYVGSEVWVFATPPNGHCIANAADGLHYQRRAGVYAATLPADAAGWLYNNGAGAKSWTDPFNINGLTERPLDLVDWVPFHDVATGQRGKATVATFAERVAEKVAQTDYLQSEAFFLGMM